MNKFLFKSTNADLQKLTQLVLTEQRAQRHDLFLVIKMLRELINIHKLQTQVDDYYGTGEAHPERDLPLEDNMKDIPEE